MWAYLRGFPILSTTSVVMSASFSFSSSAALDSSTREAVQRQTVEADRRREPAPIESTRCTPSATAGEIEPEATVVAGTASDVTGISGHTNLTSTTDGVTAASPVGASARPHAPLKNASAKAVSLHMSPPPHKRRAVDGLSSEYLTPPWESESHARTGLVSPAHVGGGYLFGHRPLPRMPGFADVPAAPANAPWLTAEPITGDGIFVVASNSGNTCAYAHPAWQPQLSSQQLCFSDAVGANHPWSTRPVQCLAIAEGSCNPVSYSGTEPYMAPVGAAPPSAMLSISDNDHSAPLSHVNGTRSVSNGAWALPVLPSVAVCAGGAQEVFWRRACLRVTCVPVSSTLGVYSDEAAKASGDGQRVGGLEEIINGIRDSHCSDSRGTGSAGGEELGALVWRWLDALGMADAVEDVISPGAGRVLVLWTADATHDQDMRGRDVDDDAWKLSTAGERLARVLGVRDGRGKDRKSAVFGAPCEVVLDAMRLLLD